MKTYFLYCFIKKWFHILVYHFKTNIKGEKILPVANTRGKRGKLSWHSRGHEDVYLRDESNYLGGKQKDAAKNNVDIINYKMQFDEPQGFIYKRLRFVLK